jgi:predicted O-methyltransferase YrrM
MLGDNVFRAPDWRQWIESLSDQMNAIIEAIYRDQQFTGRDGEITKPFPESIRRNEGEALYRMVRQVKPSRTLEVGMAWGISTLFLCQALEENGAGAHIAIDPNQASGYKRLGIYNVERAGLKHRLTVFEESSQLVLPRLIRENQTFDLIFIDGCHLFDFVLVDFFFADNLIPVGGLLIFDDLWMPSVRKLLQFVVTNRKYEIAQEFLGEQPPSPRGRFENFKYQFRKRLRKRNFRVPAEREFHGGRNINWCVVRKTAKDERPWDHFAPF